jgi:hypothetical protein
MTDELFMETTQDDTESACDYKQRLLDNFTDAKKALQVDYETKRASLRTQFAESKLAMKVKIKNHLEERKAIAERALAISKEKLKNEHQEKLTAELEEHMQKLSAEVTNHKHKLDTELADELTEHKHKLTADADQRIELHKAQLDADLEDYKQTLQAETRCMRCISTEGIQSELASARAQVAELQEHINSVYVQGSEETRLKAHADALLHLVKKMDADVSTLRKKRKQRDSEVIQNDYLERKQQRQATRK